jgi:hypothetical protein
LVSEQSVSLRVNGMTVSLRSENGDMDASEILAISSIPKSEQKTLRDHIIRLTGGLYRGPGCIPITYGHSKLLSNYLGVLHVLRPLFDYGNDALGLPKTLPTDALALYLEIFEVARVGPHGVSVRSRDLWVNASHILTKAGVNQRGRSKESIENEVDGRVERVWGVPRAHQGLYVSLPDGLVLCERYGLSELMENLKGRTPVVQAMPLRYEGPDRTAEQSRQSPTLIASSVSSAQALRFPAVQKSPRWSANNSLSWQTSRSRGLTYPSTVSGCTIPS